MRIKTALVLAAGACLAAGGAWWFLASQAASPLRSAAGLGEGCLSCHGPVAGLEGPHAPERIGCASCHAGDSKAREKSAAHAGLVLVPGNLADAPLTCARSGCHENMAPRVERSIMATMAGVIAVNRRVLGEKPAGKELPHAARLGHGVADSHLRELCVGCHLGQKKTGWGPIGEESQGGGCNACHLEYGAAAASDLARYAALPREARGESPKTHPSLTLNPRNGHCFGCHSRSGRIALSYEGWHERNGPPGPAARAERRLADGRTVERIVPDIHHERGLECIDCHTANELMGAGTFVAAKREQQRVACADCHARTHASSAEGELDDESRRLLALRKWKLAPGERMGTTRDGEPLVNVVVAEGGARLLGKRSHRPHPLKAPAAACTEGKGHERLACAACHAAWAPRCSECHTQFDPADEGFDHADQAWVRGTWNETAGPFEAGLPTLGVLSGGSARGTIDTFVPGMILTFDRNRDAGGKPDVVFRRLYAKLFSHTIRRESRGCKSCHNDPQALGLGKGELAYEVSGATGRWRFKPQAKASRHDGLPEDAWTGFLKARSGMVSTREDARPFDVAEQRRILAVGACLTCHAEDSPVMKRSLEGFDALLAAASPRCALPAWTGAAPGKASR